MKKFLGRLFLFLGFWMLLALVIYAMPVPKLFAKSHLYTQTIKDQMLDSLDGPRVIFVGGSNLSFGLDSELISRELNVNVINTGVTANFGLLFMLDNTLQRVKKDDIVILIPEYHLFTPDYIYGGEALFKLGVYVDHDYFEQRRLRQKISLMKYLPEASLVKLNVEHYGLGFNPIYSTEGYNEYGDLTAHRDLPRKEVIQINLNKETLSDIALQEIKSFQDQVMAKGAHFYMMYPCFQASSFTVSNEFIVTLEKQIANTAIKVLGNALTFKMKNELIFDTPYHLTGEGVYVRSEKVVELLKESF